MIDQRFEQLCQQNVHERVSHWMREMYGEQVFELPNTPTFIVRRGSATVLVSVNPWGDSDSCIYIHSGVAFEVPHSPDLLFFLLKRNADLPFCSFSISDGGNILLEHCLLGSTCDKDELRLAVAQMGWTADEYDDVIVSRWGGKRVIDL